MDEGGSVDEAVQRRWRTLVEARQVLRVYGPGRTLCQLRPWWAGWVDRLLEGWVLHDTEEEVHAEEMEVAHAG